jgi:thiamine-phosphate diphosphorylase / hydroxyethylthiazole kinase
MKSITGTAGTRAILESIAVQGVDIPAVAIGSINTSKRATSPPSNLLIDTPHAKLFGIAVVSAIVASPDPQSAARELRKRIDSAYTAFYSCSLQTTPLPIDVSTLHLPSPSVTRKHVLTNPFYHNTTNLVVQNFAANVCLATAPRLSRLTTASKPPTSPLSGALVINVGTITPDMLSNCLIAMRAYNSPHPRPHRLWPCRSAIKQLLAGGFFDCSKRQRREIKAVSDPFPCPSSRGQQQKQQQQQRSVDSGPSTTTLSQKAALVKSLERCIVLMTGPVDYLCDGTHTLATSNS